MVDRHDRDGHRGSLVIFMGMGIGIGLGIGKGGGVVAPIIPPSQLPGLVDYWAPTQPGFYADAAETTPNTTNNQNVFSWKGSINGIKFTANYDGVNFSPTWLKDFYGTGLNALNNNNIIVFTSDALPSNINQQNCSIFAVVNRQATSSIGITCFCSTAGSFATGVPALWDGYQRPGYQVNGTTITSWSRGYPLNTNVVLGVVATPTGSYQWINGAKNPYPLAAAPNVSYPGISLGTGGATNGDGYVGALVVCGQALTDTQSAGVSNYLMGLLNIASTPVQQTNLIYSSNSIGFGVGSQFNPFANSGSLSAGVSAFDYQNFGWPGAQTNDLIARDTPIVAGLFKSSLPGKNVAFLWEATNAIAQGSQSGAQALTSQAQWTSLWRAAGFKVITAALLNRTSLFTGTTAPAFATQQGIYDSAVLANSGGIYGDYVIDFSSAAAYPQEGGNDGTHPGQDGHDAMGVLTAPVIKTALGI